jgi:hypothetical protein
MDTKFIFSAIILIILVSLQYTLNLILREIRDIRKILLRSSSYINLGERRE